MRPFFRVDDVLRLQRTAGNQAVGRALVQRWLTIDGQKTDEDTAFSRIESRIKQAGTLYNEYLLKAILKAGASMEQAIADTVIQAVYVAAGHEMTSFLAEHERLKQTIEELFKSAENRRRLRLIYECTQQRRFHEQNFAVVIRGMSVEQAVKVMARGTFGGEPARAEPREPPTEHMAVMQTGHETKTTAAGTLEEWSVTAQSGFGTGGVIMVAVTHVRQARFPPEDKVVLKPLEPGKKHSTFDPYEQIPYGGFFGAPRPELKTLKPVGELGVTGWTDQPFARLADLPPEHLTGVPKDALRTPLCAIQEIKPAMQAASPIDAVNGWVKHKGGEKGITAMLRASTTVAASPLAADEFTKTTAPL